MPARRDVLRSALLEAAGLVVSLTSPTASAAGERAARPASTGAFAPRRPSQLTRVPVVRSAPRSAVAYRTWEAALSYEPGAKNPFDPDEVRLQCLLRSPSGRRQILDGFYYQGYDRWLDAATGREVLAASGLPEWRIRFAPTETGRWDYRVTYCTRGCGPRLVQAGSFMVAPSQAPGVVRVDRLHPHRFRDSRPGGAAYLPVGENMCWPGAAGTFDYDRWMSRLAGAGGNYVRLWVNSSFSFGLEDTGPVGNYLAEMDHAWALDYVLELAARYGVRCVLCLLWHGSFSTRVNPAWQQNPYNVGNGGPCATPMDFFSDPRARALFRRRLRYVLARWSSSSAVLAWELWNEVNWVDGYSPGPVEDWHAEMSEFLWTHDPAKHMITTSYNDTVGDPRVWSLPHIDYVQLHDYHFPEVALRISRLTEEAVAAYRKPVVFGEFGIDWRSGQDEARRDPSGRSLHDALWATVFSGGAGTAMTWWWDSYVAALNLYPVFDGLATFTRRARLAEMGRPLAPPVRRQGPLAIWLLTTPDLQRWAAWVKDVEATWEQPYSRLIPRQRVVLRGLPPGPWKVEWFDTVTGSRIGEPQEIRGSSAGVWLLEVPPLRRDVAALARRQAPP